MPTSVTMPALGESVTEGTVTRWLKQEGEQVEVDEPLLEVSTDKVDTEIPSPAAGVLQRIVVGEDETVAVGSELAVIGDGAAQGGGSSGGDAQSSDGQQGAPAAQEQTGTQYPAAPQGVPTPTPTPQSLPDASAEQGGQDSTSQAGSQGGGSGTPVTMPAL